jgi:manganese transport protein
MGSGPALGEPVQVAGPAQRFAGRPRRLRARQLLWGPSFIAAMAYVDPGNFATNVTAGSVSGYKLVWVIIVANAMAMLIQSLSAKLGLASGRTLPEVCRERAPRPVAVGLWLQAEVIAIATDLAEIIGGAVALHLLFGVPLPWGAAITTVVSFGMLALHTRGQRPFELLIMGFFVMILVGLGYDLLSTGVTVSEFGRGALPSGFVDNELLMAAGILGATVMPHVIYLHSAISYDGPPGLPDTTLRTLRFQRVDIMIALGLAGLVNLSLLVLGAESSAPNGADDHHTALFDSLTVTHGSLAGTALALALLASGLASASVGTLAGQVIMQGFLARAIPLFVRRAVTVIPALAILMAGVEPTTALVVSQVVLSFGIPFALIPLLIFTSNRDVMGSLVNTKLTTRTAVAVSAAIIAINVVVIKQIF